MSSVSLQRQTVTPHQQGQTLQTFLREELQISSRQAKSLLDSRKVFVNGKRIWMAKHTLRKGDRIEWSPLPRSGKKNTHTKITVLYRDAYLMAVNKAPGYLSDRDPKSIEALLRIQEGNPALRALHRLDRDTSGLLLFLLSSEHRNSYQDLFRKKEIRKVYQALLCGHPPSDTVTLRKSLDGKSAETTFRVLKTHGDFCKVECQIGTGRLHQIRRHALEIGCRVAGDRKYGSQLPLSSIEKSLPRQMLHAFTVEFKCPLSGKKIRIHAPLAEDFQKAVKQLGV